MRRAARLLPSLLLTLTACTTPAPRAGETLEPPPGAATAVFAGGCFWCMEKPFEVLPGVHEVVSGYTGGPEEAPTYKAVSSGRTGHTEAVQVQYDPARVSYAELVEVFWRTMDPTDTRGQFVDRGSQYRPGIFVANDEERAIAEASKAALAASGRFDRPVVVPVESAGAFWPAEDYHQDFYEKSPGHYQRYRRGSGRDAFLARHWGDQASPVPIAAPQTRPQTQTAPSSSGWSLPSDWRKPSEQDLRAMLSPLEFRVTQEEGTERAFTGRYWDSKAEGIYVDIVSGEPLYSSTHKYKSGTGWPSFWQALVAENLTTRTDHHLGYPRTELRSKHADSHLGHRFSDGPQPTGERHCINGAALRFVPKERLEAEGYGEFLSLFAQR